MNRLIAIDLPGGPALVDALRAVWDAGDAALVLDGRLTVSARHDLMRRFGAAAVIDSSGTTADPSGGRPMEDGDALVVPTSGSTGEPKGAVLTHTAIAASARAVAARLDIADDDHWLACLPLAHVGGLSVVTRALVLGTRLTVIPAFDADVVASSDATLTSLVGTALRRTDVSGYRAVLLGGGRPPADRPSNCITTYGMTETGSGVVYDGLPLDGVELDIRDDEVWVRGPMLMRGYRDGPDPFVEGWLPTGDLGSIGTDGRLSVAGRRGDMIVTGGEKVWPEPVEQVLLGHPDIVDAAVVGVEDPEWGSVVVARIVTERDDLSLDEVRDHVRATLPPWAAPREIVRVDEIERTALGKVRRDLLR